MTEDEDDPSVTWRGSVDVADPFEFPFESPPGGCVLQYKFQVQDGYELTFSVRQGTRTLLTKSGADSEGEIQVADPGMCLVRWEVDSYLAFSARSVSYEVTERSRMALACTRARIC